MNGAEERLDLRSLCSFSTGTLLWKQGPREWSLSLCVKGTFVLTPGAEAVLAEVQRPTQVSRARDDFGDADASEPTDIVPIKPRVDVLVTGGAAAIADVHVRVGGVDKRVPAGRGDGAVVAAALGPTTLARRAARRGLSEAARAWAEEALHGAPDGAAPSDLDFGVFNQAPSDQRCDVLRRREAIVLHGLLAGHPQFEGRLPGLWPRVLQFPPRGMYEEVGMRCDTLLVDADHGLAILWWRGLIPVPRGDLGAVGTIVVLAEDVNQRARVEVLEAWVRTPGAAPPASVLQEGTAESPSPLAKRRGRIKKKVPVDDLEEPTIKLPAPPAEAERVAIDVTADALPPELLLPALPTSFGGAKRAAVEVTTIEATTDALPAELLRHALPFVTKPSPAPPVTEPPPSPPPPAPPPRLGPSLLLAESPDVAQVATVAAKLASGSAKTVLASRGLTEQTWSAVERRCLARLANEAEEGRTELRDEYDEAFLAGEALRRGPFELEHLARFRVDLEDGEQKHDDAGLALDIAVAMRVRRLWARRVASDPALAGSLEAAMEKERDRRRGR